MNKQLVEIEIEPVTAKNLYALTELSVELWTDSEFETEFSEWKKISRLKMNFCALAKSKDHYAGFIHLSIRKDYVEGAEYNKTAYVEGIFVRPEYRKKGIANLLLSHAEQWAVARGLKQIASDTSNDNPGAQQFHQKAGFEEVNRIICYIKNIQTTEVTGL